MANVSRITNTTETQNEVLGVPTKIFLYVFLLVTSLVGNTLVILVILRTKQLRTNFNYLIVSMSISDLVVPLVAMPLRIVQETILRSREWLVDGALGNALCKLCFFIIDISPAVSVLTLVLIAVNRFLVITFPVRRQVFRSKINNLLIAAVWLISMSFFSPYLYTFRLIKSPEYTQCVFLWSESHDADKLAHAIFTSLNIVLFFFLPYIFISFLYTFIALRIRKNSVDMKEMLNDNQLIVRRQKNRQIIIMSVIIIVTFGLLWGPYYVFLFLSNFVWQWKYPLEVQKNIPVIVFAVQYAGFLNSAINPWIYFIFLKSYRIGLKRSFLKGRDKTNHFRLTNFGSSVRTQYPRSMGSGLMEEPCKLLRRTSTSV